MCRWLTPDSIEYLEPDNINGLNLYCYCENDPIMYVDYNGHGLISALVIGLLIFTGAMTIGGAAYGGISAGMAGGDVGDVLEGIGKGAWNGFVLGGSISLTIGGFVYGGTTVLGSSMAIFGISTSFNMLEVAFAQSKKSYRDGDGFWAGANDINNAMFTNSGKIIVNNLLGKSMVLGKSLILYDIALTLGWPSTFKAALLRVLDSKPNKFMLRLSYLSVIFDGISLFNTIFGNGGSNWILY